MKKVALIILDGWGNGDHSASNAIKNANTPFIDSLYEKYPTSELRTDGVHVGLPEGQMGNSEVGHINIGAGRIVDQDLIKIDKAIEEDTFKTNKALTNAFQYAKKNNKAVHFIGLLSNGGIHSHQEHLYHLCELAEKSNLNKVYIHAFTDGRDTDPRSAEFFIDQLEKKIKPISAQLVSVVGRYFAMDRDHRWERIKLAYDLLVNGIGTKTRSIRDSIRESYNDNITDEFLKPIVKIDSQGSPIAKISDKDVVICFNYRKDRCREITRVLSQENIDAYQMYKLDLHYNTMTNYDSSFKNVSVLFTKSNLKNTLGEVIANNHRSQVRIAETEKYPHVSFFFSGGRESNFNMETRILIPSPKVSTYDLKPSMSAQKVTDAIIKDMQSKPKDFICLNFANPDMVGHTGVYEAVIKAVETVDNCVNQVVEEGLKNDYAFLIIADHGNADFMINNDGSPNTAHTTNHVPCFLINANYDQIKNGKLADVAPTILKIMGLGIPSEMSGNLLV